MNTRAGLPMRLSAIDIKLNWFDKITAGAQEWPKPNSFMALAQFPRAQAATKTVATKNCAF
jgi:hypothetical protein